MFEVASGSRASVAGSIAGPPAAGPGRAMLSTARVSRARAASYAASGLASASGHTGVTTVITSFTESKIAISIGRMNRPSGMPNVSSLSSGIASTRRTMS